MHRMGHGPMRTLFNLWSCGSWESWDSIRIVEKHATVNYSAPRMVKKMKRSAVSTQHASWWLQPRNMMHRQFNSSVIYSKDADGSGNSRLWPFSVHNSLALPLLSASRSHLVRCPIGHMRATSLKMSSLPSTALKRVSRSDSLAFVSMRS